MLPDQPLVAILVNKDCSEVKKVFLDVSGNSEDFSFGGTPNCDVVSFFCLLLPFTHVYLNTLSSIEASKARCNATKRRKLLCNRIEEMA